MVEGDTQETCFELHTPKFNFLKFMVGLKDDPLLPIGALGNFSGAFPVKLRVTSLTVGSDEKLGGCSICTFKRLVFYCTVI